MELKTNYSDVTFKNDGRLKLLIIVGTRPEIIRLSAVINKCRKYFDTLLDEVKNYMSELRCVIQITVSPVYGQRMRETMMGFNASYADFGARIVEIFGCTPKQAETFIYSTLSAIIDYVVWEDGEKTQLLLDNLYGRIAVVLGIQE